MEAPVPRMATVRSASLAPDEIALVDRLAEQLAGGSFTELTRRLLRVFGEPLSHRLDELVEAGMDPHEQLVLFHPTQAATDPEIQAFYAPSSWPEQGPTNPPSF
jgi:hypothetical protein